MSLTVVAEFASLHYISNVCAEKERADLETELNTQLAFAITTRSQILESRRGGAQLLCQSLNGPAVVVATQDRGNSEYDGVNT